MKNCHYCKKLDEKNYIIERLQRLKNLIIASSILLYRYIIIYQLHSYKIFIDFINNQLLLQILNKGFLSAKFTSSTSLNSK